MSVKQPSSQQEVGNLEQIEVLPWGLSEVTLTKPLEVSVDQDAAGRCVLWTQALRQYGEGDTYEDAVMDLGAVLYNAWDELREARVRDAASERWMDTLSEYLPDDALEEN